MTEFYSWYVHASLSEVSSWVVTLVWLWTVFELIKGKGDS